MLGFRVSPCASFASRVLSIAASWLFVSTMPSSTILAQLGYQLDSLPVQALKQSLRDIPPIPEELPVQFAAQPADNVDALAGRELVNAETGTRAQVSTR